MPSDFEYALMAGRAYFDTRADINRFPVPDDWTEFFHAPNAAFPAGSGFEAISFQRGDEIVISFAGIQSSRDKLAILQAGNDSITCPDDNDKSATSGRQLLLIRQSPCSRNNARCCNDNGRRIAA